MGAELVAVDLPGFGEPTVEPELQFPAVWARIQARRTSMQKTLGLRLKPEVVPFSNLAAWLPPFLLDPGRAMALRG